MSPEIKFLTADEARRFLNNKNVNWDHWPQTKKYLESIIKKETKMEQKSKWYKPWTWFGKKEKVEAVEFFYKAQPDETYLHEEKAEIPSLAQKRIYTPPRNIPKKRAVKKPAKKKQAVKRGKK